MYIMNRQIVYRREFDGSAILFNPDNNEMFALNETGAEIYELLLKGLGRADVLERLARKTTLPPEAAADFDAFIEMLESRGCIGRE